MSYVALINIFWILPLLAFGVLYFSGEDKDCPRYTKTKPGEFAFYLWLTSVIMWVVGLVAAFGGLYQNNAEPAIFCDIVMLVFLLLIIVGFQYEQRL